MSAYSRGGRLFEGRLFENHVSKVGAYLRGSLSEALRYINKRVDGYLDHFWRESYTHLIRSYFCFPINSDKPNSAFK